MKVYRIARLPAPEFTRLDVDDVGITHRLFRTINRIEVYVATTTFADIQGQADFSDYAFLGRLYDPKTQSIQNLGVGLNRLVNIFNLTKPSRVPLGDFLFESRASLMLGVFVPFADSPIEDWAIAVPAAADDVEAYGAMIAPGEVDIQGSVTIIDVDTLRDARDQMMPRLSFGNGPTRDGNLLTFGVTVMTADGNPATNNHPTIFFETTAGALLTARNVTQDGLAVCVIDITGVPPGTYLKVKAGFKHYPGLIDYEMTV